MSTFEVYIDFQDGGGEQDYSVYLRDGMVKNGRASSDDFHCAQSSVSFSLVYEATLLNKLLSTTEKMLVRIVKNSVNWFVGFIPPTISLESDGTVKTIQLEALDFIDELKKKISDTDFDSIVWDNHKIFDSADKPNSICHKLLYLAGFTDAYIDVSESITDTVEVFVPSEDNYYDVLNTLLWEYGWTLRFDEAGKFHPWNWARTIVTKDYDLDETTAIVSLKIEKEEINYEGAEVIWYELATRDDTLVFKENLPIDSTTGDLTGQVIIHQTYWPIEANVRDVYQSYSDSAIIYFTSKNAQGEKDFSSIVKTVNHTLDTIYDTGIVVSSASYGNLKAKVAFFNSDPADDTLRLYAFNIRADVTYRSGERTSTKENISGTTKLWEYDSRYLFSKTDADRLSCAMAEIARGNAFNYQADSEVDYPVGSVIELSDPGTGITQLCYIISKTEDVTDETYSYKLIGIAAITIAGTGDSGLVFPSSPEASSEQSALQVLNRPTYTEVQEGYTEGGGTVTPTVPTLIVYPVATKALYILVDRQLNLTNFDHYEIQVCADDGFGSPDNSWYSLEQNGTDWKDAPDPAYTEFEVESFTHVNIPNLGSVDDPLGRLLHYRCRRVTKDSVKSSWSTTVSNTTNVVDSGDVAASAIFANNLVAGIISSIIAEISNYLQVGGSGYVSRTYGETNGYQEVGLSGLADNQESGLTAGVTYYYKITADGGTQVEYNLNVTDTIWSNVLQVLNATSTTVTWEIVDDDLRCTSRTTGEDSSVVLAQGTTGTDFFTTIGWTAFNVPVDGLNILFRYGATRARIYEDSFIIEYWDGDSWEVWMKMGGEYNNSLFPYLQGRGVVTVGAEDVVDPAEYGEKIPSTGTPLLYAFDNTAFDQNEENEIDGGEGGTGAFVYSTTNKKFGTHALVTASYALVKDSFGTAFATDFYFDFWFNLQSIKDRAVIFRKMYQEGTQWYFLDSSYTTFGATVDDPKVCKIGENKFVLIYRETTTNDINCRVGVRSVTGGIAWGTEVTVRTNCGTNIINIIAISDTKVVVSCADSSTSIYYYCGVVNVAAISFGSPTSETGLNNYSMCRLDQDKFLIVSYNSTSTKYNLKVGSISTTTISFGTGVDLTPTAMESPELRYSSQNKAVMFYRDNSDTYGYLAVITVSGTTPTINTAVESTDSTALLSTGWSYVRCNPDVFILAFVVSGDTLYYRRVDISGTTITLNTSASYYYTAGVNLSMEFLTLRAMSGEDFYRTILTYSSGSNTYYLNLALGYSSTTPFIDTQYTAIISRVGNPKSALLPIGEFNFFDFHSDGSAVSFKEAISGGNNSENIFSCGFIRNYNDLTDEYEIIAMIHINSVSLGYKVFDFHVFSVADLGWMHFSMNVDTSVYNMTLNNEKTSFSMGAYSLTSAADTFSFFVLSGDALDDLLMDITDYVLTEDESIAHFRYDTKWNFIQSVINDLVLACKIDGYIRMIGTALADKILVGEVVKIGEDINGEKSGLISAKGIYHPDEKPDSIEYFPFGEFIKWDFENNLEDQRGLSWPVSSNVGYDSTYKKFGSYSLTSSGTGSVASLQSLNYYYTGESLTVSFWFRDTTTSDVYATMWQLASGVNGFRVQTAAGKVQFRCIKNDTSNFITIYDADINNGEFHFIYFSYDSISDIFSAGVDDVFEVDSSLSGTWPGTPILLDLSITVSQAGAWFQHIDELVFSPYVGDIKLLREHYTNNLPYDDNISKKDVSIIVPENGKIHFEDQNDINLGTLHLLSIADRPSAWLVSSVQSTTYVLHDFSSYVPFGVKAVVLQVIADRRNTLSGNLRFRPYGSSEDNLYKLYWHSSYFSTASSIIQSPGEITVPCDVFGRVEWRTSNSTTYANFTIIGYYI